MSKRDPVDEELDFGEERLNAENEERIESLTNSISQLKTSASFLHNQVENDGKIVDQMNNQLDDLMEFLNGTKEKLKKLLTNTSSSHLLVLFVGGILILLIIYYLVF